jgi:hypothetical protein
MTTKLSNDRPPKIRIPFNVHYFIAFFLLILIIGFIHQMIHHTVGYILSGQVGYLTFDMHKFSTSLNHIQFIIAQVPGPMVNYIALWAGMILLIKSKKFALLGFTMMFAAKPMSRFLCAFGGGDEVSFGPWLLELLRIQSKSGALLSVIIALLIIGPPLTIAFLSIGNRKRLGVFLFYLFIPVIAYVLLVMIPDHALVVPSVYQHFHYSAPLPLLLTLVWGLPIILIFLMSAVFMLFFGKYLKLLMNKKE